MINTDNLTKDLVALDESAYFRLLQEVHAQRTAKTHNGNIEEPRPGMPARSFARWIAVRHLESDPGIQEVVYLPADAPPNEVRLLELNVLLRFPEGDDLEVVDFSPDISGVNFLVAVADVTPTQWDQIKQGQLALPENWKLDGHEIWGRQFGHE
jgi:hypothetical protein